MLCYVFYYFLGETVDSHISSVDQLLELISELQKERNQLKNKNSSLEQDRGHVINKNTSLEEERDQLRTLNKQLEIELKTRQPSLIGIYCTYNKLYR